jgi:hypothetical protein
MRDMALDAQLRALAQEQGVEYNESSKRKWVAEVTDFVWQECTSEDIEVIGAGGDKAVVAQQVGDEGDDNFDVAKKYVAFRKILPSSAGQHADILPVLPAVCAPLHTAVPVS